jgi:flagellar hook-associated protein 1 FlgK
MSNFGGLDVATKGLAAHQRRIEVIGENLVNANTPGYHRQRVELQAVNRTSAGVFSGAGRLPGGVDYSEISRLRDQTLEVHARKQAGVSASASRQADLLSQIEQLVGGLDGGGLHDQLQALWNGFDDLANSPDDLAIRDTVLQRAERLAQGFTRTTGAIDQLRQREQEQIFDTVEALNTLTSEIAALDSQIIGDLNSQSQPNALLDRRDQRLAKLAELADLEVAELDTGQLSISVDGQLVVSNGRSTPLSVGLTSDPTLSPLGYNKISVISPTGRELTITAGELAGSLSATASTIPDERRRLDDLIADLAAQVNGIHQGGSGLDGSTGLNLFDIGPGTGTLTVSSDVAGQPEKLAAAAAGAGDLDDSVARAMAQLSESPTGPSERFTDAVGALAARVATAQGAADAAAAASLQATNLAQSVGGVSLDEELTELIMAQRSYEASARLVTAIDEMLLTLVNSTGRVGL